MDIINKNELEEQPKSEKYPRSAQEGRSGTDPCVTRREEGHVGKRVMNDEGCAGKKKERKRRPKRRWMVNTKHDMTETTLNMGLW